MRAIAVKEFRELRRDRRTLAMLFLLPFLFLVVFGYAASFDIKDVPTVVVGPGAPMVARHLPGTFAVVAHRRTATRRPPASSCAAVRPSSPSSHRPPAARRRSSSTAPSSSPPRRRSAVSQSCGRTPPGAGAQSALAGGAAAVRVHVLYNPDLRTAVIMIPGLCGIILVFVGTVATALGVVRERQSGTMEQLAVMPFRPRDVFLGKIAPYLLIAAADMVVVVVAGMLLFDVPFRGSVATFALGALLFLFVTLGTGVLISSVSQTQGQAIQLAMMTMLPQFLLSGLFFPLYSMPWAVRWIGYLLPLTWFIKVARGVMVRGAPIGALWLPLVILAVMAVVVFTASTLRFRRDLAPAGRRDEEEAAGTGEPGAPTDGAAAGAAG